MRHKEALNTEALATARVMASGDVLFLASGMITSVARTLYDGGVRVFEITATNSASVYDGVRALKAKMGTRMRIGAGTASIRSAPLWRSTSAPILC